MNISYRQRVALIGGVVGTFAGVLIALAYLDQLESNRTTGDAQLRLSDAIRLGAATIALLRQISELGR